jgi:SAM-dependent methyltransferase
MTDGTLDQRLDALCADGWENWQRFDQTFRQRRFHPFVPADYDVTRKLLASLVAPGPRFLEWGSATGIITIMAEMLGFEACGIEIDPALVAIAVDTASRHRSAARFVTGSFLPTGYQFRVGNGDGRTGTIGDGPSGYLALGRALEDFDVVFGYPWGGEEAVMLDVMRQYGRPDALLILYDSNDTARIYRGGHAQL